MKQGLVLGKFMPLHSGHVALIRFAACHCDHLTLLLAVRQEEPIPGPLRLKWLKETFGDTANISIAYTEEVLPDAPVSDREVSRVWAGFLSRNFPQVQIIFSSEPYGEFLAEFMGIEHKSFDPPRQQVPVSASDIRRSPFLFWEHIPHAVRPFFRKKICIYGPESTGKSTLTRDLASHFGEPFVPEVARDLLGERHVVYEDILPIAIGHGEAIVKQFSSASRFLFCDTDLITTRIYSEHYFGKVPSFPPWVIEANSFDFYLFCDIDVPWVEDCQRDLGHLREYFRDRFLDELATQGLPYAVIAGSWEERFAKAVEAISSPWPCAIGMKKGRKNFNHGLRG